MKSLSKKILILLSMLLAIVLFIPLSLTAKADDGEVTTSPYLPSSYLEYYKLNSPIDIAYSNNAVAIIEHNQKLVIYANEVYKEYTSVGGEDFTNTNRIKFFDKYLILVKSHALWIFDYENETFSKLLDTADKDIPASSFDFNSNYLIAKDTNDINIYTIVKSVNGKPSFTKKDYSIDNNETTDKCISINENNDIFYLVGNTLKIRNVNSTENSAEYILNGSPVDGCRSIIVNKDFLFFADGYGLGKFNLTTGESKIIVACDATSNNLEKLKNPKGLAFKGENVLVCDGSSVVEYDLEGNYTGFAITTKADAFNRIITTSQSKISNYGDRVAVMNSQKVLIISRNAEETVYENYYFNNELQALGFTPETIVLGENKLLLSLGESLAFFDLTTKELSALSDDDGKYSNIDFNSACYSNGYFYVLDGHVWRIDEETLTPERIIQQAGYEKIAVDVDGFVYVTDREEVNKYGNQINAGIIETYNLSEAPLSIGVDLNGNLFALLSNNVIESVKKGVNVKKTLNVSSNLGVNKVATAFSLDYASEHIYILFGNDGLVLTTNDADNDAITKIEVPNEFGLTSNSGQAPQDMKIYKVNENANKFEVNFNVNAVKFEYLKVVKSLGEEYILVGETENFFVLANDGEDGRCGLVLVKKEYAVEKEFDKETDITNGFVVTKVYLYRYPLFTENYQLIDFDRLPKNTAIQILGKVGFNEKEFYFATVKINEQDIGGYLPVEFVRENLVETFTTSSHEYRRINGSEDSPVTVYDGTDMSNELIAYNSQITLKTKKVNEQIYAVYFVQDGVTKVGYIYATDLVVEGKNVVRNAIIIVIASLSVTVTSIYFIVRRKNDI